MKQPQNLDNVSQILPNRVVEALRYRQAINNEHTLDKIIIINYTVFNYEYY